MDEDDDFQCCSMLTSHSQDVKQVLWMHNEDVCCTSFVYKSILGLGRVAIFGCCGLCCEFWESQLRVRVLKTSDSGSISQF